MSTKAKGLINRITSIGLDFHTDSPCVVQVEHAAKGVLHFVEVELSDEIDATYGCEVATSNTTEWTGDFYDFLRIAIEYGITQFAISGILTDEFIQILNSDEYRSESAKLVGQVEASTGSGIQVIDESSNPNVIREYATHQGFIIPAE